jgi:hypothetical protein
MTAFNKPDMDSGAIVTASGLCASSAGIRVNFSEDADPAVIEGPFALGNLVSGFWLLKLHSMEQAIEFAKKVPFKSGSVEVRKLHGPGDFE